MRTTVNLPDDVHRRIVSVAKDTNRTMSEALVDILRRGLGQPASKLALTIDSETGLPQVELGDVVTTDEVRSVTDED
jgi:predicted transcriptional regulator